MVVETLLIQPMISNSNHESQTIVENPSLTRLNIHKIELNHHNPLNKIDIILFSTPTVYP